MIQGYNGTALEIFGAGGRTGADGPSLTDPGWHHLVFGYYGSAAGEGLANRNDIYIDGVLVSAQTNDFPNPLPFGGGAIAVGGTVGSAVQNVHGQMDEVAVYDLRVLPDANAMTAKLASISSSHYQAAITTNFGSAFATDLQGQLADQSSSLYVRKEFVINDAEGINRLTLRMKYDDAFVAWLNGMRITLANAPETVAFDATAITNRPAREANAFQTFDLSAFAGLLVTGTNVLAVQGLNTAASDADFLLSAELTAQKASTDTGYLLTPTPGLPNGEVLRRLGPRVTDVPENLPRPAPGQDLVISARVAPTLASVTNVQLIYRVMYDPELSVPMFDNGVAPDAIAADGVYSAAIPGSSFLDGQMIRWAVLAEDASTAIGRAPAFVVTNASPQYFGTVALNPAVTSAVPILEWFLPPGTELAARTRVGTAASVFFNGEFYDNVNVHLRGRTAASLDKNPYEFNFNAAHDFRYAEGYPRVKQFALNTTWRDKAYVRQVLCWDLFRDAGVPYSVAFPLHVRRNNAFFSVAIFVEIPDKDYLRRNGLNPDGALYKADLNGFTVQAQGGYKPVETGFEKKEPDDTDFSDIIAFTQGLGQSGDALTRFVFDNVDLPCQVNYMAVCVVIQDGDRQVTNFYPYRDTPGSGEWCMLPWDMDLSLGQVNNSVDEIQTTQDYPTAPPIRFMPRRRCRIIATRRCGTASLT